MKAYDYLYFGLYRLMLKTNNSDIAEYYAVIILSIGLSIDIFVLSIPLTLNSLRDAPVKAIAIAITICIGLVNYFYFVSSGRYRKLIEEYKDTSSEKLQIMNGVAVAFCFLSLMIPFIF